ncbi:hypothetical protein IAQ61_003036 [Plenodomus lingam]|uniref:Predicted protein n=1 Tax=Leptosphaeria maculans (strain JN3 / isolate v23.1.3 / race Av1-4-5-6-7-8) TaxID=985895 RepID=E5ADD3_LEPMJ|nr:predicted protein [Plenodomus lingam JN3]KAH9875572.1 hypothetical protein IAQ61_003036 [Plenodomus lingam]CBY01222.1 predicted protein [Plenodomus lingam JN3]
MDDQQQHHTTTAVEVVQALPSSEDSKPSPLNLDMAILSTIQDDVKPQYDSPLYTEINIPLPRLPTPHALQSSNNTSTQSQSHYKPQQQSQSQPQPHRSRPRSRTLSSLSPFRRPLTSPSPPAAGSGAPATATEEQWPRIRKEVVKSKEIHAMMDLTHHGKKKSRRGTIDALAVVPAVLVLSAELFTPGDGQGEGRSAGRGGAVGRWRDGII